MVQSSAYFIKENEGHYRFFGHAYNDVGDVVSTNGIAKWNRATNTWSAVGNGGVNGLVSALAVSGSDLYVGGWFDSVHNTGGSISANNIAKLDTLTNTWSALAGGINGGVNAIAVSGLFPKPGPAST